MVEKLDINKLALFDVEYMFLQLRASSISNILKVAYVDNDDKETRDFDIDLSKVNVKFPDPLPDNNIKINDQVGIILKYPPASLYSNKDFSDANATDMLIKESIEKIYNSAKPKEEYKIDSFDEFEEWLQTIEIDSYNNIKEYFMKLPTLYHEIKYTNKNGKDRTIVLNALSDFFTLA